MKVLIKKRGNERGRYYSGRSLDEITRKFIRAHPNFVFIRLGEFNTRYEIFVFDFKQQRAYDYVIPKEKIIKGGRKND